MKNHILTACTVFAAAVIMTGCASPASLDGTYVLIDGTENHAEAFRTDPDAALDAVLAEQIDSGSTVVISGEKITVSRHMDSENTVVWNGNVNALSSALSFKWNDVTGSDPWKDLLSEKLEMLNNSGSFPTGILPRAYLSDLNYISDKGIPIFSFRLDTAPSQTEVHDGFLCTPVYGFTMEDTYRSGQPFRISYSPEKSMREDYYSSIYLMADGSGYMTEPDEATLKIKLDMLRSHYALDENDALQFKLSFSNGLWEMSTENGKAVSKGNYAESQKHSGLITMYSEQGSNSQITPVIFYIDRSNSVFYPGYIKKPEQP